MTSISSPPAIAMHELHSRHGVGVGLGNFSQFSALARIRAIDVLPVPRVPVNRYAWAIRSVSIAFLSVCAIWFWPTTSSNVRERYFLARTVYDIVNRSLAAPPNPGHNPLRSRHDKKALERCRWAQPANRPSVTDFFPELK